MEAAANSKVIIPEIKNHVSIPMISANVPERTSPIGIAIILILDDKGSTRPRYSCFIFIWKIAVCTTSGA